MTRLLRLSYILNLSLFTNIYCEISGTDNDFPMYLSVSFLSKTFTVLHKCCIRNKVKSSLRIPLKLLKKVCPSAVIVFCSQKVCLYNFIILLYLQGQNLSGYMNAVNEIIFMLIHRPLQTCSAAHPFFLLLLKPVGLLSIHREKNTCSRQNNTAFYVNHHLPI